MSRLPCVVFALVLALAAAAQATPPKWQLYPRGDRAVAVEPSPHWLLLDTPRADAEGLEAALDKQAPGAVLASLKPLDEDRLAVEIHGLGPAALHRLGEALVATGYARRFWPGLARGAARGFFDDHLSLAFDGPVSPAARKGLAAHGIALVRPAGPPDLWVARALDGDGIGAAFAARGLPGLRWAEPDLIREIIPHQIPREPEQARQWHLESPTGRGDVDAEAAWAVTTGDPAVVVAVFEVGGFDVEHPELASGLVPGFDWADGDDDPSAECRDGSRFEARRDPSCPADRPYREAHGTAVAGIIGARSNGVDGVGLCPDCSLMLVRLSAREALRSVNAAGAFRRAADGGATVINNSWGPAENALFPLSLAEEESFNYLALQANQGKGVVVLFSAGNVFQPATNNPYNAHPHTVVVAASTFQDDFACYSSYGSVIDVAAPSMGCFDNEPGIATTDVRGAAGYAEGDFTTDFSGTSAAAPVAAGVVALILSANPALTAQQARLVLQLSADPITARPDWQRVLGRDLATEFAYDARGHSLGFGYGRVNAGRAVALARALDRREGAACGPGCPRCVADRCAPDCGDDADCPGAWRCLPTPDGGPACQLPTPGPGDLGSPCTDACEVCVASYDSEPRIVQICSTFCEEDRDCPFGFDCRLIDPHRPPACVRGHQTCATPWGRGTCDARTRVEAEDGTRYCSCRCVQGAAGACPEGFLCADVTCRAGFDSQSCAATPPGQRPNEAPHCVPDPEWRKACAADADCALGDHCLEGRCGPDALAGACAACAACTTDADCGPDHTCEVMPDNRWRCTRACEAEADCPGDSVCRAVVGLGTVCVDPGAENIRACATPGWRCSTPGRCAADGDCPEGPCAAGFCAGFGPPPPTPDGGVLPADGGISVLPGRRSDPGGCRASPGQAAPTPWGLLWLLGAALLSGRRRRP